MAMGEGGPELVKQLLSQTYDINMPGVVGVYMTGEPQHGVGPHLRLSEQSLQTVM